MGRRGEEEAAAEELRVERERGQEVVRCGEVERERGGEVGAGGGGGGALGGMRRWRWRRLAVRGRPGGTGWPRRRPRERRNVWRSAARDTVMGAIHDAWKTGEI
jgi:hypothetical protein